MLNSVQTVLARLAVSPRRVCECEREGGRRDAWAGDEGMESACGAGDSMRHGAKPKQVGLKHRRSNA
jgi:hypothetical protein